MSISSRARTWSGENAAWGGLFPLPTEPFERLMLLDDRLGQPMTFFGELTFAGEMQPDALQGALDLALGRHPLLHACIEARGSDWYWIPASQRALLDVRNGQQPIEADPTGSIDLRHEPGVRLWARVDAGRSYLVLQFHHACCDGRGAMRFIEDVLIAYAAQLEQRAPEFAQLDVELLRARARFRAPQAAEPSGRWSEIRRQLRDAFHFHTQRPTLLARPATPPTRPTGTARLLNPAFPGTITHYFRGDAANEIHRAVARAGATLNDVAVALLLKTLAEWNTRHGAAGRRDWLRLLLPNDLRERSDLRMPAANRMSLYFLARRAGDCCSVEPLLAGIRHEMQFVKQARVGLDFLQAIGMAQRIPGAMNAVLRWPRSLATALLTNMSDPTRGFRRKFPEVSGRLQIGNLALESITGSPPLRQGTLAGFGIGVYADQIMLNLKCDPRFFTAENTQSLLDAFETNWRRWAGI